MPEERQRLMASIPHDQKARPRLLSTGPWSQITPAEFLVLLLLLLLLLVNQPHSGGPTPEPGRRPWFGWPRLGPCFCRASINALVVFACLPVVRNLINWAQPTPKPRRKESKKQANKRRKVEYLLLFLMQNCLNLAAGQP